MKKESKINTDDEGCWMVHRCKPYNTNGNVNAS